MSICLCMIVKNEAHVIESTLENIVSKVTLSYWVISDTGSTDETCEKIVTFFRVKNIPGELVKHAWKDFAYNRTKALECAFGKTDYLMVFDADDSIVGNIDMPILTEDIYVAPFDQYVSYLRPLFINNRKRWHYTGVLHEYLDCDEKRNKVLLKGNYYIFSGRTGSRNKNPNKYIDDAKVLMNAFHSEPRKNLKNRYAFYCAQSLLDAKKYNHSIEWYKVCLSQSTWDQERYCSCIQIGNIYAFQHNMLMAQYYWKKSIECDPQRIEGVVLLAKYFFNQGKYAWVNQFYHRYKNYKCYINKLFLNKSLYYYELEFLNALSAWHVKDPSGYDCCKTIILKHKNRTYVDTCINQLKHYKKDNDTIFLQFLKKQCEIIV